MNRDWMVMCLGGFPTQVNSYAGKGKDKDNKAHNGATNKADSFSWDITKVAKGVKVKIDRPYADSSPPDTGWYVDERGKKQDYIVGVKLWSVSSSWTDENGILITTLPMLVGMEVDNYDKGPSALLYQLDRDEHHHHIYSTRGVFSVLTWKGNTN